MNLRNFFADLPRMAVWFVLAVLGALLVWWFAPHMVKVTLYKLTLLPAAAYLIYRLDRAINERQRPHELLEEAERLRALAAGMQDWEKETMAYHDRLRRADRLEQWARDRYLRRTILMAAGLVAVALGS